MSSRGKTIFVFTLGIAALGLTGGGVAKGEIIFGKAVNLGPPVNSSADDVSAVLSADGLELYFDSTRPGGYGFDDIWVSKRASVEDPWGPPVNLGPGINSGSVDAPGSLSADGLTLYWKSGVPYNVYMATRATRDAPWGARIKLDPPVNTASVDGQPEISADGLELFFATDRAKPLDVDVWVSTRASTSDSWGPPVSLGPVVNSPGVDWPLWISPDSRTLLLGGTRAGGFGSHDVWIITRSSKGSEWTVPRNLGPAINTPSWDWLGVISPDGTWCYVGSNRPGGLGKFDIWQVPIFTIVDFNGDGSVDGKEILVMVEHWGTGEALCDIGPFPFGDGTVDLDDLRVLAGYIGQDVNDPTLVSHWKLDEASGTIAADSAGTSDGTLIGDPTWQPAGGKIGGALEFDGGPRFATVKTIRDPSQGPFSVIAWVKGGAPGGVIVSQESGVNWLYVNQDGMLTTGLKSSGRGAAPLTSSAFILDDQWHRVAFVWDGANRALHMDGVEVARDAQSGLSASSANLQIGAGSSLAPGSFWSGLIDDVRVYSRAVKP